MNILRMLVLQRDSLVVQKTSGRPSARRSLGAVDSMGVASALALVAAWSGGCSHHQHVLDTSSFSTAPPPGPCSFMGKASGTGIEATRSQAMAHARENLGSEADRLAGTYVQLTTEDTTKVEMAAMDAVQVRLEGRVYRCTSDGAATPEQQPAVDVGSGPRDNIDAGEVGSPGAMADPRLACPAGTVPRALDAADGPGWQCARKLADSWVAEGPYRRAWSGGATRTEGAFENGKRTGQWSFYYSNGQVRERATFRDGAIEGCADEFDAEGAALPPRCSGVDAGAAAPAR